MNRPSAHAVGLTRRTQGLSEPHRELILLLAQIAVQDYLRESELAETNAPDHKEALT